MKCNSKKPKTGITKKCLVCNKEFYCQKYKIKYSKYCSHKCHYRSRYNLVEKNCVRCGKLFKSHPSAHKLNCSDKCARISAGLSNRNNNPGKNIVCKQCSKVFYACRWQIKQNKQFCSQKCRNGYMKFIKHVRMELIKKPCLECNQLTSNKKFCSIKCLCRFNNKMGHSFNKRTNTKPEQLVKSMLNKLKCEYTQGYFIKYKNSYKIFDFYLPEKNILLEVDGIYWHSKNIKLSDMDVIQKHNYKNDKIKNILAKKEGYKLCRIWSDEITLDTLKELIK